MILMRAAANFDIERAVTIGRIAVGKHRRADLLVGDWRVMPADIGGIPQNVGRAVVVDRRDDFNASLVVSLHRQQALFWVLIDCIDVDQFVVDVAEQHQVADVVGEQRRTNQVTARSRRGVGDDVRHEAEILVLGAGDQVPDQGFVASRILTPTRSLRPEDHAGERGKCVRPALLRTGGRRGGVLRHQAVSPIPAGAWSMVVGISATLFREG